MCVCVCTCAFACMCACVMKHVYTWYWHFHSVPRNPNDSILERNDAEFVAKIRDAVINELEVEKQSANAYVIWREQEKQEGAFRRGMTRLRQSFRRQRAPGTSAKKEEPAKLEGVQLRWTLSNQVTLGTVLISEVS